MFAPAQPSANVRITKRLVDRSLVRWSTRSFGSDAAAITWLRGASRDDTSVKCTLNGSPSLLFPGSEISYSPPVRYAAPEVPSGEPVSLYDICHSRAGDKGNTANVSLIPYDEADFSRLCEIITDEWAEQVFEPLLDPHSAASKVDARVYRLEGVRAFNIVVAPVLDGGVTVSRRIDVHGKSLSDLVLQQQVTFKSKRRRLCDK
eukprot:gnl/TRDRNA2_/TRDRNA2_63829_c1_seq1.p1 gnl/TRDRNA2_/TRDRNA2_63829_c1~~gnl/TRDRNA2_/TRDRNA2_63829_c1_seq1.p1  ORF type:complete len:231 (+),score=34.91 gnl/TRDRNA2_/TRDRNA2_63829_c1_seq1:83-694(+)